MTRLAVFCLVALLLAAPAQARHRRFKRMIDPNHAEEILSSIALNPRLDRDEWLDLLSYHRDESYVIKPGDTLWGIAQKTFGNAFLWRKLWQVNAELTNPHELTTGQILAFYREGAESDDIRIGLVKLVPNQNGTAADLDSDSVLHLNIRNQFRPSTFVIGEDELLGEIVGAYENKARLGELDELFLSLNNRAAPAEGQHYGIVRLVKRIKGDAANGNEFAGWLVNLQGEVAVTLKGEDKSKAELVRHYGIIERGDRLIAVPKAVSLSGAFNPPAEMRLKVVGGQEEMTRMFGQGQIVLLDKGSADGVRQGFMFRVFRNEDPYTEEAEDVLPDAKGEIQIVYASELSSVGYIIRNKEPILLNDLLVPAQMYRDAPPPPTRKVEMIDLD